MQSFVRIAAVAATLLATVALANADSAHSGKTGAHITQSGLNVPAFFTTLTTVQLPKGAKKRILEVDASFIETTNVATALGITLFVNGVQMEPLASAGFVTDNCTTSTTNCNVSGHFWMDLDAAESANPGGFIGVPLTIEMRGAKSGGTTVTGIGTIDAHLVKK